MDFGGTFATPFTRQQINAGRFAQTNTMSKLCLNIGLCLLLGLLCSLILSAQTLSSKEAQINCGVDLIQVPMAPYGFAMATLKSLSYSRTAVTDAMVEVDAVNNTDAYAVLTGMMRATKLSTNDFICAKQAVQPFTSQAALSSLTPDQREYITTAAAVLVLAYDKRIDLDGRMLHLFKELSPDTNMVELSDQLSTMQVESGQAWSDLVRPVFISVALLVDMRATDENGNFIKTSDPNAGQTKRLTVTKAQKLACWTG